MKKILLLLLIPVASFGQLSKNSLNGIIARDIQGKTYSSDKMYKLLDSMVLSLALQGSGGGGSSAYTGSSPTTITLGGLSAGTNISAYTVSQVLSAMVAPFIGPVFNSFAVTGLSNTLEVGTTLSGSKTFTWTDTPNSSTITTIDIHDVTASTTLASGLSNTGSSAQTIATIQLNSNGASQTWNAVGHYTGGGGGTFTSGNFTSTGRFFSWWGAVSASLTNSASVRALANSQFQFSGNNFTILTGTTLTKFVVAVPPGFSIVSVIDTDALGANITASFIAQTNINVLDAGSTNRSYPIYEYNVGSPYATSHHLVVTTN